MYSGLLGVLETISLHLCWVAPFTFVFCLIYAIRDAVKDGKNDIGLGLGAAVSLLIIIAAILLN